MERNTIIKNIIPRTVGTVGITILNMVENVPNQSLRMKFDEIFNFPLLPYVCQRLFAEICDSQTLKFFGSINSETRNLCKRCHIVKEVDINYGHSSTYLISCYCKEGDFCKGVNAMNFSSSFKSKYEVMEKVTFKNFGEKNIDAVLFQNLPIKSASIKEIDLKVNSIDFDFLKKFVTPELKILRFEGGIHSHCKKEELLDFIKSLIKLDKFLLNVNRRKSPRSIKFFKLYSNVVLNPNFNQRRLSPTFFTIGKL